MTGLLRWWSCIGGVLLVLLMSHCGGDEPATQLTARIYLLDPAIRSATLHVTSASQASRGGPWTVVDTQSFPAGGRPSPVDVHFVPKDGTPLDKQIEVVVEARDAATGASLAQERALVSFVPKKQRLLELWLAPCGDKPVCEESASCRGSGCQACVSGQCGTVRAYAGASLPALDPTQRPNPDKRPNDGGGGNPDATTCAIPGTSVVCDDGNLCNGRESCEPNHPDALANGCAVVTPEVTCEAGSTCVSTSGACVRCSENSDGDRDGVAADRCGGRDCDDSDANISPDKPEICDGKNNDCRGGIDDAEPANADCVAKHGVGSTCVMGACTQPATPVTIRFRAVVGSAAFACSREFELGTPPGDVQPRDFRFFVQEVLLINAAGQAVPVQFAERAPFQARSEAGQVALVDFGGDACDGDAITNVQITGTAPAGEYVGVELVNGVPPAFEALAPELAPAPLQVAGARGTTGYRYVMAAVRPRGGAAPGDAGAADAGAADAGMPADAGTGAGTTAVYLTQRNRVRIMGFDPADDVIVANFAPIFGGVDVASPSTCESAAGCMASYEALGAIEGAAQSVFAPD